MTSTTTRQVYAIIAKKSKANRGGATGADTVSHLQAIEELLGRLGRPLRVLVTECDLCAGLLLEHFRSPLALESHVKAVVAAMKLAALPKTPEAEARWASALAAASDEEKLVRERILQVLARSPKKASQETLARYANSLA
jgi:D-serine deaminase-like pyridoxal phosphate-dependent protein